jgi:hypothetical protein
MPNQRAKNKVLIGAFIDRDLKRSVMEQASRQGLTTTEVMIRAIHEYVKRHHNDKMAVSPEREVNSGQEANAGGPAQAGSSSISDEVWLL